MSDQLIARYFPDLTETQRQRFDLLGMLLPAWNERVNLISRKDIEHLYERHILHSLGIAKVLSFKPGTRVIDVGTGGGFPGIPLAIMFPEVTFHLIDGTGKKINAVQGIIEELGLENATAEKVRSEEHSDDYDFVVSRAVTDLPRFVEATMHLVRRGTGNDLPNGILYLKGGPMEEELDALDHPFRVFELRRWFTEPFFETKKVVHVSR